MRFLYEIFIIVTKLISILRVQTTYETSFFLLCNKEKKNHSLESGKYTKGPLKLTS